MLQGAGNHRRADANGFSVATNRVFATLARVHAMATSKPFVNDDASFREDILPCTLFQNEPLAANF